MQEMDTCKYWRYFPRKRIVHMVVYNLQATGFFQLLLALLLSVSPLVSSKIISEEFKIPHSNSTINQIIVA